MFASHYYLFVTGYISMMNFLFVVFNCYNVMIILCVIALELCDWIWIWIMMLSR